VLAFTLLLAVAAGVGAGLLPAFQASKLNLTKDCRMPAAAAPALATSLAGHAGNRPNGVIGGAAGDHRLDDPELPPTGQRGSGVRAAQFALDADHFTGSRYRGRKRATPLLYEMLRRVKALGRCLRRRRQSTAHGVDDRGSSFNIIGDPPLPAGATTRQWRVVSSGYFQTMQMPVKRGRSFNEQDQG